MFDHLKMFGFFSGDSADILLREPVVVRKDIHTGAEEVESPAGHTAAGRRRGYQSSYTVF